MLSSAKRWALQTQHCILSPNPVAPGCLRRLEEKDKGSPVAPGALKLALPECHGHKEPAKTTKGWLSVTHAQMGPALQRTGVCWSLGNSRACGSVYEHQLRTGGLGGSRELHQVLCLDMMGPGAAKEAQAKAPQAI